MLRLAAVKLVMNKYWHEFWKTIVLQTWGINILRIMTSELFWTQKNYVHQIEILKSFCDFHVSPPTRILQIKAAFNEMCTVWYVCLFFHERVEIVNVKARYSRPIARDTRTMKCINLGSSLTLLLLWANSWWSCVSHLSYLFF